MGANVAPLINPFIINKAIEIANSNPDGFTVAPDMLSRPTSGYCVAHRHTQNSFGLVGFLGALAFAINNDLHFGGWYNRKNGLYYFDAVRIFPIGQLEAATNFAKEQEQIALFDLANGMEISTL